MKTFLEPAKEIPVYGKYDTVVVGGGFNKTSWSYGSTVNSYNKSLTRSVLSDLPKAMLCTGATVGNYGLMVSRYADGALAVACVPLSMMERAGAGEDDAEDISALPGQIEGTLGSVVIRELRSGQCKVSVRTQARWLDANGVCTRMGGGGHPAASGCTIPGDMARAKAEVLAAVAAQFAAAGR